MNANPSSRSHPAVERLLLVAAVVLVVGVRLLHVDDRGLWEDEALRYFIAMGNAHMVRSVQVMDEQPITLDQRVHRLGSLRDVLRLLRTESPYGPGYYVVLHETMRATGFRDPALLKQWNVIFAGLTAAALWWLARLGLSRGGAMLVILLYAFSAWDLGVSLQLKEQALATLSVVASTRYVLLLTQTPCARPARYAILHGVILGVGLLTHGHVLFLLPLHGVFVTATIVGRGPPWLGRPRLRDPSDSSRPSPHPARRLRAGLPWLCGVGLAVFIALPWLVYAGAAQYEHLQQVNKLFGGTFEGWAGLPHRLWEAARTSLLALPGGLGAAADDGIVWLMLALIVLGATGVAGTRPESRRLARLAGVVCIGALALAAASYLFMRQNQALWPRYFVLFLPLAWIALAAALDGAVARVARAFLPVRGTGTSARDSSLAPHPSLVRDSHLAIHPPLAPDSHPPSMSCGGRATASASASGASGGPRPFAVALLWLLPLAAVATLGVQQSRALPRSDPLDMWVDYRAVAETLKNEIRPDDIVAHAPAANAFRAFACHWTGRNTHVALNAAAPDSASRLAALADRRPIWLILTWGQDAHLPGMTASLAAEGYIRARRIDLPRLVAIELVRNPG